MLAGHCRRAARLVPRRQLRPIPGTLTASAFSIVVLGGLGSVSGSLIAAYVVGYLETMTAYLIAPTLRPIPALLLLVLVVYVRPQGLFGRS